VQGRRRGSRIHFLRARVDRIDLDARRLDLCCGGMTYDILVIALGSVTRFYGLDSVEARALEMKFAGDAEAVRCHIINHFEAATRVTDPAERRRLLTFVVVGGGCTGIETVTELHEFIEQVHAEQYPELDHEEMRTVLVEIREKVLPEMGESLSEAAERRMHQMGIELMLNTTVADYDEMGLTFAGGRAPLPTDTVVWAAGVRAPDVVRDLPLEKDKIGRIVVGSDLVVPGRPEVYAMGDNAHAVHPTKNEVYSPTAQVAYRQSPVVAANIAADLRGDGEHKVFDFDYIGDLVSLGKLSGVANPYGIRLRGVLAWGMWKFYYLSQLVGWQNRLRVVLNWLLALFFPRSSALSYECSEECVQELCPDVELLDTGIEIEESFEPEPVGARGVGIRQ
ncbi:MAG TPA: FAD-dependent oxidoreductase, partial [Anaerolineae bacterium]|nr:FAD-dependent oxidoreductase [Anaerolineae bacterium]